MRLRLRIHTYPRPAIVLANSPHPNCPDCKGDGGWTFDYAGPDGEYGGTDEEACGCWEPDFRRTVLPIPRRLYYWRAHVRNRRNVDPWGGDSGPF